MDRVIRFIDGDQAKRQAIEAIELSFRNGWSWSVRCGGAEAARIIGPSDRQLFRRVSADVIRSMGTLRQLLDKGDVVVTSHKQPYAVIVPLDEYERLTGRRPEGEERLG